MKKNELKKENFNNIIEKESERLNSLLETQDLKDFKELTSELKDSWIKKQVFRTETEARFSVLQDNKYPTKASKYWQCVREQASNLDSLMRLSFDYRRNVAKIEWLRQKIENEKDDYKSTKYKIDLDESYYTKASMEKIAKHRIREMKMWSKLKAEYNDGSFNDQDVNQHQLESYGLQYFEKSKYLNEHSSENEKSNVLGQLRTLQRIKNSDELERLQNSYLDNERLLKNDEPKS